jgi:L-amino acid N-acyltransferase
VIRPATRGDAEALMGLLNHWIEQSTITFNPIPKTLHDIEAMIGDKARSGHALLVAEVDGVILGYATYGQFRAGVGYARAMEHSIALAPQNRGSGVGRALLGAIEDHARAGGAHSMMAGISGENAAGQAFHAACGYVHVATIPQVGWKFGRWLDLVLMQKILS